MEASFCGCNMGQFKGLHFNTKELKQMGRELCRCLLSTCEAPLLAAVGKGDGIKYFKALKDEAGQHFSNPKDIKEDEDSASGSDDNPSDGNLNEKMIKVVLPVNKKGKGISINSGQRESWGIRRESE